MHAGKLARTGDGWGVQLLDYCGDNDRDQSAKDTVGEFARTSLVEVVYCTETEQNISLARNKALEFAKGDLIAWIDDDEFPNKDWLLILFKTLQKFGSDGVLGP